MHFAASLMSILSHGCVSAFLCPSASLHCIYLCPWQYRITFSILAHLLQKTTIRNLSTRYLWKKQANWIWKVGMCTDIALTVKLRCMSYSLVQYIIHCKGGKTSKWMQMYWINPDIHAAVRAGASHLIKYCVYCSCYTMDHHHITLKHSFIK